jgi:uncharacterized protein YndB with AHSA1/START domain
MNAPLKAETQSIVVDEVFPHAPEVIWKALTNGDLIARWLHMPTKGFAPVKGAHFTFQTTPAGAWDGLIRCEVLEVVPNEKFAHAWRGGDEGNTGYGSKLDTVVTWTLTKVAGGTRVRMVHSGFVLPKNETAYTGMSNGWKKVVPGMVAVAVEQESAKSLH